jgi:uncharacterized protein (DUF1501 family)
MGFQTPMDKRSYLSLAVGLGMSVALFSSVFVLAFVAKLLTRGQLDILSLLGFAGVGWVGGYGARYALRATVRLADEAEERPLALKPRAALEGQIMLLARAAKGVVSAAEVAAATQLSADESHQALRALVKQGTAEIWVTDEGGLVYAFPELLEGFKEGARSPLVD